MENSFIGIACALGAALTWAFALIFFMKSGQNLHPISLNFFKNTVAIILLILTLLIMGEGSPTLSGWSSWDIWILVISGILGVTISDTLFFYSLNIVGVGISSIVDCLSSPLIIFWSFLLLSEKLTGLQYIGAGLVVSAVLITTNHTLPAGITRKKLVMGILVGILCRIIMTFGIVIAKPVLTHSPIIMATTVRLLAANLTLGAAIIVSPQRKTLRTLFIPSKNWKFTLPASVLGAYLAMVLWIGGYKYIHASIAGILNQTATIFAIILAAILLKESFTKRKLVAVVLAMVGIVFVTLG